jgi:hypothetical protein
MDPPAGGRKDPPENPGEVTIWPYREVYSVPPGLERRGGVGRTVRLALLPVHWERYVGFARPAVANSALEFAS